MFPLFVAEEDIIVIPLSPDVSFKTKVLAPVQASEDGVVDLIPTFSLLSIVIAVDVALSSIPVDVNPAKVPVEVIVGWAASIFKRHYSPPPLSISVPPSAGKGVLPSSSHFKYSW